MNMNKYDFHIHNKSSNEKQIKKSNIIVIKCLNTMKDLLVGVQDHNKKSSKKKAEPRPQDRHMLAEHAVNMNVFIVLITQMHKMPFESKKNLIHKMLLFNLLKMGNICFNKKSILTTDNMQQLSLLN